MFTFAVCLSALLGLAVGLIARPPAPLLLGLAASLMASSAVALALRSQAACRGLLVAALATLLAWHAGSAAPALDAVTLNETGERAITCVVASDPEQSGLYHRFVCRITTVGATAFAATASVIVTAPGQPTVQWGDTVAFVAALETPHDGETAPGYAARLRWSGVGSTAYTESLSLVRGGSWSLQRWLYSLRRNLLTGMQRAMPSPESAFAGGVVLGSAEAMPDFVREDLRRSGLLHILVVSGYNVSMVAAMGIALLRRRLGWKRTCWAVAAAGAGYAVITGGDPPVLRALVMVLLGLGARVVGRPRHGFVGWMVAVTGMAALSPPLLLDASFQLSAAATAGLLWVEGSRLPLLEQRGALRPVAEAALTSLAATITTLPFLAAHTGSIPILGVFANVLAQPLQSGLFLAAALAAAAAALPAGIATVLCVPATLISRLLLTLARITAGLPLATINTPRWGMLAVAAYLAIVVAAALAVGGGEARRLLRAAALWLWGLRRRLTPVGALLVAIGVVWPVALDMPDGRLHVAFLDVGQGDAILITSPTGRTMLIDGGRDPDVLLAHLGRALPFWRRDLDVVAVTHADMDHLGGLLGLPRRYRAQALLAPAMTVPAEWQAEWQHLQDESGDRVEAAVGISVVFPDGVAVEVLSPDAGCAAAGGSDNDCSLVLRLTYGEASVLLMGDAEAAAEARLLPTALPATALKVGHHGSARCSSAAFLARVAPQLAVISVGDNRYGHPAAEVLMRLEAAGTRVLRTDQAGTVELLTDGSVYAVVTGG
ncbi:MAG: DNA internalization-related competence protein ComEC/Rec2 [Anaerolineae bacterium]